MDYQEIIINKMKKLGINRKQLSVKCGIPYSTLTDLLTKESGDMTIRNLFAVCRELKIPLSELTESESIDNSVQGINPAKLPAEYYQTNEGIPNAWYARIVSSYENSPMHLQKAVCNILEIEYIPSPRKVENDGKSIQLKIFLGDGYQSPREIPLNKDVVKLISDVMQRQIDAKK